MKRQQSITNYFARPFSTNDKAKFEQLLLHMIISNNLSFTFLENQETKSLFEFLSPGLSLPTRRIISERVLIDAAKNSYDNMINIAKKDSYGVTVACDGWSNVKSEKIWGVVLLTSQGQPLIWGAYDVSSETSKTEDIIRHIELLMVETRNAGININAFVSDSAGEYVAAR